MKKRLKDIIITAVCVTAVALTVHYHYYVRESYVACEDSGVSADEGGRLYFTCPYARLYRFLSPDGSTEFIWVSRTKHVESLANENEETVYIAAADEETASNENRMEIKEIYYIPKSYVHFRFSDDPEMAEQEMEDLKGKSELLWKYN